MAFCPCTADFDDTREGEGEEEAADERGQGDHVTVLCSAESEGVCGVHLEKDGDVTCCENA